jgi:hypothetical protein
VTTAISALERRGLVTRREDGAWVLGTPEGPAADDDDAKPSPWGTARAASLLGDRLPELPIDIRLAELSEAFKDNGN